jgi:hypothetical protein
MTVETEEEKETVEKCTSFSHLLAAFRCIGNNGRDEGCEAAQLKRMLSQPR